MDIDESDDCSNMEKDIHYRLSSSSTESATNTAKSIMIANETNEIHIIEPATTIPSIAKPTPLSSSQRKRRNLKENKS